MKDQMNKLHVINVIPPADRANIGTTPIVGTGVNLLGYASLFFAILLGALTDTNATYAVLVEEADDNGSGAAGTYAAVADDDLIGTEALAGFTFANDGVMRKIGYRGNKQWVRLTITPTGADAGNSPIAAVAILGNGAEPTSNPPA